MLNDRQLTYMSDDIRDLELLIPAHLLHTRSKDQNTTTQASYNEGTAGLRL